MGYYDNFNPTLLDAIAPDARRIVEFGCGAGALARAVKGRMNKVFYGGLELQKSQLDQAADVLDFGLVRNFDQMPDWSRDTELQQWVPEGSLDHIIFGDVLEHLYDPLHTLTQATRLLAPGGKALLCIPNVQHWSVFVQLIAGSWPKTDGGLFDRTHIRWFTLRDMQTLVAQAGLQLLKVEERIFSPEVGLPYLEDLEALACTVGVDPNLVIQRGLPLQYVLVAQK